MTAYRCPDCQGVSMAATAPAEFTLTADGMLEPVPGAGGYVGDVPALVWVMCKECAREGRSEEFCIEGDEAEEAD